MPDKAVQYVSEMARAARCLRTAAEDPNIQDLDRRRALIAAKLVDRVLDSHSRRNGEPPSGESRA